MRDAFRIFVLIIGLSFSAVAASLQQVDPLNYARVLPRSEIMADGKMLVLGGYDDSGLPVDTVEIFNPENSDPWVSSWTVATPMSEARYVPTLTRLKNGTFLVTGGYNGIGASATCEVYDPVTQVWSSKASMLAPRYAHTATLLPDGRVLVTGGYDDSWGTGGTEIYDPVADSWTSAGTMAVTDRFWHTATLIGGDRVLVAGSPSSAACEVYNIASNTWTTVGSMTENRYCQSTVLLPNGKVMVIGGFDYGASATRTSTEIFDPSTGLWSSGGSLSTGRYFSSAVNDGNGHIYVVGGYDSSIGAIDAIESFDIATGGWSTVSGLTYLGYGATGRLLPSGSVVFAGGGGSVGGATSSILLVLPPPPADADYDGLTFAQEIVMSYDPSSEDTGNTGVSDASKDIDGDGFSNLYEIKKASSSTAGLNNALNTLSDNSSLPVGATKLSIGRRMYASHAANDPEGPRVMKSFSASWRGTYNAPPQSGTVEWSAQSTELDSKYSFLRPREISPYEYDAYWEAYSTDGPDRIETADLVEARFSVHLEPTMPIPMESYYVVRTGTGGYQEESATWSSFSLTVPAGSHDSNPMDIKPPTGAPVSRGNGFSKTLTTIQVSPVGIQSLAFNEIAGPFNFPSGALILANDANQSYGANVWLDSDKTGKPIAHYEKIENLSRFAGINEAIGFVAGSTPVMSGIVQVPITSETIKLKATCSAIPGMDFPETELLPSETVPDHRSFSAISLSDDVGSEAMSKPEGIEFDWKIKVGDSSWMSIGKTKHRFYVTANWPKTKLRHETIFRISCAGKDVTGIWNKFKSRNLQRLNGSKLTYYKEWNTIVETVEELLEGGDGQCGSFHRLFRDCLALQGMNTKNTGLNISYSESLTGASDYHLAVDLWHPNGAGSPPPSPIPVGFRWANRITSPNTTYIREDPTGIWRYDWIGSPEFEDIDGIQGQGGVVNPKSIFSRHYVVEYDGVIYDPSYGESFESREALEISFSGFVKLSLKNIAPPSTPLSLMSHYFFKENSSASAQNFIYAPKDPDYPPFP